ncbi:MAG: DUF502 domain-containing protein [Planctomycetota bacterium]
MAKRGVLGDFRTIFGRGLAILLPSIVTLWLLWQVSVFLFNNVAEPINRGVRTLLLYAMPSFVEETAETAPDWYVVTDEEMAAYRAERQEMRRLDEDALRNEIRRSELRELWSEMWWLNLAGLLVAVLLIYLAGRIFGNYIGRRIYARLERLIAAIPGFKQVYPHVKQVVDLIFGDNSSLKAFREAVLVQYPREGLWSVGLVTGESFQEVRDAADTEIVSIFIPTSPTPMTGFVINAPRAETIKLDITIDQALRFVITAGVLTPDNVVTEPDAKDGSGVRLRRAHDIAESAISRAATTPKPAEPQDEGDSR